MNRKKWILIFFSFFVSFVIIINSCKNDNLVFLVKHEYTFVTVKSIYPITNGLSVLTNTSISIEFSQPMDSATFPDSFNLYTTNTITGVVEYTPVTNYTINWSTDKTIVNLVSPLIFLNKDSVYSLKLNSSILRSASANPLQSDYFSTFVTGSLADGIPPNILSYTLNPSTNNLSGSAAISGVTVYPVSEFKVVFDDTMVKSTVQGAFSLTCNASIITPSAITWSTTDTVTPKTDDTVTFSFNSVPQNASCTVNLSSAALDKGGNSLTNPIAGLQFFNGSVSGADGYESNNTSGTATQMTVNSIISANVNPAGDVDWYKITLNNGSTYNIRLNNQSIDLNMELIDSDGITTIPTANNPSVNGTTANETISYTATATKTYYIKVWSPAGIVTASNYSLLAELVAADAFEADNTPATANITSEPATITGHTLHLDTDVDYFKFTTVTNRSYTVQLNMPATVDYDVIVYQSDGVTTVVSGLNAGAGVAEIVNFTALNTGPYYIKVSAKGGNSSQSPYTVSISSSAGVDYTVSNIGAPSNTTGGAAFTSSATVQNAGGSAGVGTTWTAYISSDTVAGNAGDTNIGSGSTGALAAGATFTVPTINGTWPVSGTYYILVSLTTSDDTNTANNTGVSGPYTMGAVTGPTISTVTNATYPNPIVVTWNNTGSNTYYIERSPTGAGTWSVIGSTTTGVVTFNDSNAPSSISPGTTYDYRVRGYNTATATYTNYSNTLSGTRSYAALGISPSAAVIYTGGTVSFSGTGGSFLYTYSIFSGGGTINNPTAGLYTAPGTAQTVIVRVTDTVTNQTADATVNVFVPPALSLNSTATWTLTNGGITYWYTGGVGPYTYSIVSGVGTINASTGAYTAPATAPVGGTVVTVKVTDGLGQTATRTATVYPLLTISPTTANLTPGGSQTFTASGGTGIYTFAVTSGGGSITSPGGVFTAPTCGTSNVRVSDGFQAAIAVVNTTSVLPTVWTYTETEPNNSFGSANCSNFAPINPTQTVTINGFAESVGVYDWVSFTTGTGTSYTVSLTYGPSCADYDWIIFNASGVSVTGSYGTLCNSEIATVLLTPNTNYYIAPYDCCSNIPMNYVLTIKGN
ncbi:MAG: pre-peptidase C-terminal domain-containing protein [Spirochaetota bacterium]|nr:pre-peptidase C-terminal domain-containing protein [Spirochaetota bacterium]